ncbi:MAG: hypothetical protein Q4D96_08635 [Propionibacteriaceae bacterium]|nr:hypothetical protein [Propionibacteriaceae bacterium]
MAKRTRDPEGRRNLILRAAGELIRDIGVSAITHRKVAEKAQVPLGSTTQYFTSLTDLITEALTGMAAERQARLDQVVQDLLTAKDVVPVLAELVEASLTNPTLIRNELSFWLLHTTHPKLKQFMRIGDEAVLAALAQRCSKEQAEAVMIHIYGLMLHAAVQKRRTPRAEMEESFRRLLSPTHPRGDP